MTDSFKPPSLATPAPEDLEAHYGDLFEAPGLSEDQRIEILAALWTLMASVVALGFSVKPGDKFYEGAELGMEDVINWIVSTGSDDPSDKPSHPATDTEMP